MKKWMDGFLMVYLIKIHAHVCYSLTLHMTEYEK